MAIFHLHVKNISRGDGRSVIAAAAYRAGETLPNEAEERDSAFGGRRDVLHAEIRLPAGAPAWMADRAQLWNGVEKAEIRKDARLAKEIEVALPRELTVSEWLGLARELADTYVADGFAVDLAIHDDGSGHNPHAHLLLTTRTITPTGFGPKIRDADGKKFVLDARKLWAKITNTTFAKGGSSLVIDHRSHAEAGIDREPSRHQGPDPEARRARREQMKNKRITAEELKAELIANNKWYDGPAVTTIKVDEEEREIDTEMHGVWGQDSWLVKDVPVPDPQGNAIPFGALKAAEEAMIETMEQPAESHPGSLPDWQREDPWWKRRHNGTSVKEQVTQAHGRKWWRKQESHDEKQEEPDRLERARQRGRHREDG